MMSSYHALPWKEGQKPEGRLLAGQLAGQDVLASWSWVLNKGLTAILNCLKGF